MRHLTIQQKKVLDRVIAANPTIQTGERLSSEVWEKLIQMNDTEILWQEVNRYITDAYYKREYTT